MTASPSPRPSPCQGEGVSEQGPAARGLNADASTAPGLNPDGSTARGPIETCPHCGCRELFIRKDFPQKLGLGIVIVTAIVAFILLQRHTLAAMGLLVGVTLLDALIYLFVGRVTVCYRCRAQFRGAAYNPAHTWFDLATAEKYPKS